MEFESWDALLSCYLQFLKKPEKQQNGVRFIMDRHDDQKILGYIEDDDEKHGYKEFVANLTFNTYPLQYVMIGGFHFFPTKVFQLNENE